MWRQFISNIIDAILPLSSEAAIARSLSEETLGKLLNPVTHAREPWITALFSYYNPKVRALIRAIKYRGEKAPLPALGAVVAEEIMPLLEEKRLYGGWGDILMAPVPSSAERLRTRGYNQADRIALAILPHLRTAVTYAPDILGRENRESQVNIPKERRHKNIQGAFFALRPEKIRGACILLIDDVVESGTTLKDAKRALMAAGATDVMAVAIAH